MAIHIRAGDILIGEAIVYETSKVTVLSLIKKSEKHRGLKKKLFSTFFIPI